MLEMIMLGGGRGAVPPGNNTLLHSYSSGTNKLAGYYGRVAAADFISMADLLALLPKLKNSVNYNLATNWLKFYLDGKVLYVAQKPILANVSWDAVNNTLTNYQPSVGKRINIKGFDFNVRSLSGTNDDYSTSTDKSEYDRLLYSVVKPAIVGQQVTNGVKWDTFSLDELGYGTGDLSGTWTRSNFLLYGNLYYAIRGADNDMVPWGGAPTSLTGYGLVGFRPVLELAKPA